MSAPRGGALFDLAMGLFHRWDLAHLFMHFTAYMDEAGTDEKSKRLLFAAVVGSAERLRAFDAKWGDMLRRFEIDAVHADDLHDRKGEFKGWSDERRMRMALEMDGIRDRFTDFGVVGLLHYSDYIVAYEWPLREPVPARYKETPYQIVFRHCIARVIDLLLRRPGASADDRLTVIVEYSQKYGSLRPVFFDIRDKMRRTGSDLLTDILPGRKADYCGLQAADAVAYATKRIELGGANVLQGDARWIAEKPRSGAEVIREPITCSMLEDYRSELLARMRQKRGSGRAKRNAKARSPAAEP